MFEGSTRTVRHALFQSTTLILTCNQDVIVQPNALQVTENESVEDESLSSARSVSDYDEDDGGDGDDDNGELEGWSSPDDTGGNGQHEEASYGSTSGDDASEVGADKDGESPASSVPDYAQALAEAKAQALTFMVRD